MNKTTGLSLPPTIKGRGAGINTKNPFFQNEYSDAHPEGIDEPFFENPSTKYFTERPRVIINKVDSPDVHLEYSLNPYQGCEHGCVYCYARPTHTYWGFSAGIDFEQKIIVKPDAPALLEKHFLNPKWQPCTISLSGNTDCYQPVERRLKITRKLLEIFLKYKHPVSIITKNSLILRDIDLLKKLADENLVCVMISITTLKKNLRALLEPRTASAHRRLETIRKLSKAGIPSGVMVAPIIPGLNSYEIPAIIEKAASAGARSAGYTMVRLNGPVAEIFSTWIRKNFPDQAAKVLHQIAACHGGKLNDSRRGIRMRGEGNIAESVRSLFHAARQRHIPQSAFPILRTDLFIRPGQPEQMRLF